MRRNHLQILNKWLVDPGRKPMIIRGARQVGKSTLVRIFAKELGRPLVEVNLERHRRLEEDFASLDVTRILNALSLLPGVGLMPRDGILFLDEIQATPSALAALRYLHEERPNIPILAAGSLLEFILTDHDFSMPVGRISYLHMGPMSFEEYLLAIGASELAQVLVSFTIKDPPSKLAHQRLNEELLKYCIVGGMPASVLEYSRTFQLLNCRQVQQDILDTYRDDFAKYGLKQDLIRLQQVMDSAALYLGKKVKYSEILPGEQPRSTRRLLDLLVHARLLSRVHHSAGSGLPLSAEMSPKVYKLHFVDVGLWNCIRQAPIQPFLDATADASAVYRGVLAEQLVGQEILAAPPFSYRSELFYWLREARTANAELDYIIGINGLVLPIEVKAGASGRLRSLKLFCESHHCKWGVRFGALEVTREKFITKDDKEIHSRRNRDALVTELISLPLYGAGQVERLLKNLNDIVT